jgi:hypothetical protein
MVSDGTAPVEARRRPPLVWVLAALLTLEFLLVAALAVLAIASVAQGGSGGLASGIALAAIIVLAAIWLAAMVVGLLRGQSWVRAAGIVWQVIQIAVGVGILGSQPAIGIPLLVAAVLAFILLFTPSVVAATRRRDDTAV